MLFFRIFKNQNISTITSTPIDPDLARNFLRRRLADVSRKTGRACAGVVSN